MERAQPEHPGPDAARSAEAVTQENHAVPLGPEERPQDRDASAADEEPEDPREPEPGAPGGENLECPPPEAHTRRPEVETIGAFPGPQEPPRSPRARQPEPDFYCVKWIPWKGARTPVIMQSTNGPCPLLAIMNILFLQWKVRGVQTGVGKILGVLLSQPPPSSFLRPLKTFQIILHPTPVSPAL